MFSWEVPQGQYIPIYFEWTKTKLDQTIYQGLLIPKGVPWNKTVLDTEALQIFSKSAGDQNCSTGLHSLSLIIGQWKRVDNYWECKQCPEPSSSLQVQFLCLYHLRIFPGIPGRLWPLAVKPQQPPAIWGYLEISFSRTHFPQKHSAHCTVDPRNPTWNPEALPLVQLSPWSCLADSHYLLFTAPPPPLGCTQ